MNLEKKILSELNPPQLEAVKTTKGPLLILAGAGSGKTKTLTHRIAFLIAQHLAQPWEILAVTFTNKAAGEMRERLAGLLNQENSRSFMPWMGTFHSIAVRILRQFGEEIEIPHNFVILDEGDRLSLVKSAMRELNITDRQYHQRGLASQISNAKNQLLTSNDLASAAKSPAQKVAAEVFARYERIRKNAKSLDFDDLLNETVRLLSTREMVRQKLQQKFRYILIDEYQDTNAAQYKMIKLLSNEHNNVCAVGDDWQSIYSWRGADFTNILNFQNDFPGAKVVKLEQNYRSTEAILNAAHNVIIPNEQRSDKKLWTAQKGGQPVQIIAAHDEQNEAQKVGSIIQSEVTLGARQFHDFAILYRTNAQSRVLEENFLRLDVPYKIVGGTRFYDRAEIKDLLAYLKFIYQPFDQASFVRVVNVPKRSLGETSVGKFLAFWSDRGDSILESLDEVNDANITSRAKKELKQFGAMIDALRDKIDGENPLAPAEILEQIVSRIGYEAYLRAENATEIAESKIENVRELIGVAQSYLDVASFLEDVSLVSSADAKNDKNAATMMTLHAAKGLEFPVVFMVGLEESLFPAARAEYEPSELEEERRLCYVGMTRAREELYLTFAKSRFLFGQRSYNMPSRFLSDVDPNFDRFQVATSESVNEENFYGDLAFVDGDSTNHRLAARQRFTKTNEEHVVYDEENNNNLQIGDRVQHQIFGVGVVKIVDGSVIKVDFNGKLRNLNVEFAPLQKL